MSDDRSADAMTDAGPAARWWGRLHARRAVLATAACAFLVLLLSQAVHPLGALLAFSAIALAALLAPASVEVARIAAREETSNALQTAALSRTADALPDPCFILQGRSVVLHRNPVAARDFPMALVGDPIAFSMRNPALLDALETVWRGGGPLSIELHQTVPSETWHRAHIAPLAGSAGGLPEFLLLSLQHLTEQKRVDAMRADFIANASHELRTPLTSLSGFIDTLLGPAAKDAAAREKFLGIMRTQAARMSKLIDDLLSLSRIEMRQHLRPAGQVELGALLGEVCEALQVQAREAEVSLELTTPLTPAPITGDRDELYEVFENLVDNAIKYGGDGGRVTVGVEALADRHGFDYAVTVADFGPGIPAEHVPRLTERFYRVDAESSRKKKGTGLGLAIVKHILNRHRGTMTIRSQPGEGTRVEVLLPK